MQVSRENIDEFVLETVFNDNGAVEGFKILGESQKKVMDNQDKMKQKTAKLNAEDKKLIGTTNQLSKAFKSLFAVFALKKIVDYTEQWANIRKTMASITEDEGRRKYLEDSLYKTALATGQSLEQTAKLYKSINTATKSLNLSDKEQLLLVEDINKALATSGTSISENEATVKKLMRALASGELKPRAVASLIDEAPQLAKIIADGFGVSIERLREMAKEGRLTSDKVFKAILSQTSQIDAKFQKTGLTLRQSFENLSSTISKIVDSDIGGFIGLVSKAMNFLANNTWVLQTVFAGFVIGKGAKMILYLTQLRTSFLALRAPIGTLKNSLQMIVSGDIIAGFASLVKWTKAFAVASWTAVSPWLSILAVVASILIIIDQIIAMLTGKESLTKQLVYKIGDLMTGQNKSSKLGVSYLGTGGVKPAVYPTSNNRTTNVKNDFVFNISGSQSPMAVGREVDRVITQRLRQVRAF